MRLNKTEEALGALKLACGSAITTMAPTDEVATRRARLFSELRRKACDTYESWHTDGEILEVLWWWSLNRKFENNIVKVQECCPEPVWQKLAKMVKIGGLRAFLRSHPYEITIIQDQPLEFCVHSRQAASGAAAARSAQWDNQPASTSAAASGARSAPSSGAAASSQWRWSSGEWHDWSSQWRDGSSQWHKRSS